MSVLSPMSVYLLPGDIYCAAEPAIVTTILGSCVAVCLWDTVVRISGINHFVLPMAGRGQAGGRYGDSAIDALMARLCALGGAPGGWRAKVFGGAAVLSAGDRAETVGGRNVELALGTLRRHGIPVVARSTGGTSGRLIRLHTATGAVDLRRVAPDAVRSAAGRD